MNYILDVIRSLAGAVTSSIMSYSRAPCRRNRQFHNVLVLCRNSSVVLTINFTTNIISAFEWANRTRNRVNFKNLMGLWTKTVMIIFVSESIMIFIFRIALQSSRISFLMKNVLASTMNFILNVVIKTITLFALISVLTIILINTRLSSRNLTYKTSSFAFEYPREKDLSWCISFAALAVMNLLIGAAVTSVLASTEEFSFTVVLLGTGVLATHALILSFSWTMIQIVTDMFIRGLRKIFGIDCHSSFRKASRSQGVRQLNYSVWEFYSPKGKDPGVDIGFFNGLQLGGYEDAFWTTWLARNDEKLIWPKGVSLF